MEDIAAGTAPGVGTHLHAADRDLAERPEPVRRHRGRRRQGQAGDLRDGSAQPEPSLDRPGDRHALHGVGRPGRRRPERDLGPVDLRERRADHARRQLRLAVLHGLQAGLPRPPGQRRRAHGQPGRATSPAVPPRAAPRAGTTATTCATTRPTTRASSSSRTPPARAPTPARSAATTCGGQRGNPSNANGCPEFPRPRRGGATAAPNYGATPTQGCPYVDQQRPDDHERPRVPLHSPVRTTRAAGPSTGTAAGSCTTTAARRSSTACCWIPATDQNAGLPVYADSLRNTLTWGGSYMDSKFGPDGALYVQTYDGFFRAGTNIGIYRYDYIGGAPTPGAAPRAFPIGSLRVRFSSAAPAASRGSGTSATARSPPRPTRRTPTPRPSATRRR